MGRATGSCISTLSLLCSRSGLANDSQVPSTELPKHQRFLIYGCCLSSPKASSVEKLVLAFACQLAPSAPDSQGKPFTTWFPAEELISVKEHHVIRCSCLCSDQTTQCLSTSDV